MATNPLFQGSLPSPTDESSGGLDPFAQPKPEPTSTERAAELIRAKLDRLYKGEPDAAAEIQEAAAVVQPRSKHQEFMYELSNSGKGLAEIQTEWHRYYENLPDEEKHEVWQEFYAVHDQQKREATATAAPSPPQPTAIPEKAAAIQPAAPSTPITGGRRRSPKALQRDIRRTARGRGKMGVKHHLQALLFGLGFGGLVLVVALFGFFNEVIIAPFIQPSRTASATPIIFGTNDVAPTKDPEVIIPKLNLEAPLQFGSSTKDDDIENALEDGVVHYPTTVQPGQQGNTAFFGHSSNNIFNPGKYKFIFSELHKLVPGDTFYLTYNQKIYAYQVYDKKIVEPTNVSVLNNVPDQVATATLITCDPPGTSLHRLVVWGKQVSPDPASNAAVAASTKAPATNSSTQTPLPGNGPSLWSRFTNWLTGNS